MKLLISIILAFNLFGCAVQNQNPREALTPREACLQEAKVTASQCMLIAGGYLSKYQQPNESENKRICQDRKLAHEDRCYARFK